MQTLRHNEDLTNYQDVIANLEKKFELKLKGVPVEIIEHHEERAIELSIDGKSLMLTLDQARDLKNAINKSINLISKTRRRRKAKK